MSALPSDLLTQSRIMVTGGAGFIGSNMVEVLSRDPSNFIVAVDDLSTGDLSNLSWMKSRRNVAFRRLDVCKTDKLAVMMGEGVDVVLHEAAIASVQASIKDPVATNRANVQGTLSCLQACVRAGVKGLVFASSCAVYGDQAVPPLREDGPVKPTSPYGVSKLAGESYCRVFHELYGIHAVSLRYFNVHGPRQNPDSEYSAVVPKFIKLMASGVRPTIHGDGEQTRDFVYVQDVIRANCMAAQAAKAAGRTYNVASGKGVSVNRLADLLRETMGVDLRPTHGKSRPGDIRHSWGDPTRARRELGFKPLYSLEQGLEETISHFLPKRG
jgi:nucleoside-diphosphate-sugar epimerase